MITEFTPFDDGPPLTEQEKEIMQLKYELRNADESGAEIYSELEEARRELAALRAGTDIAAPAAAPHEFWTEGNLMALGAREIVKRHEADMAAARVRVPFTAAKSDEELKEIAIEAYNEGPERGFGNAMLRAASAIRAALAAGGIEPCAAAAMSDEDLARDAAEWAFREIPNSRQWRDYDADAKTNAIAWVRYVRAQAEDTAHLRARLARTAAKSSRRRAALKALNRTVAAQSDLIQRFLRAGKEPVSEGVALRQPGWELDVTKEEMYSAWHGYPGHDSVKSMQAVLDLCRSRIRPVYECAECANWKVYAERLEKDFNDYSNRINAAINPPEATP